MSDIAQGPGWWLASDGKWYPPRDESQAPAPGWWLASDGKWYPPMESEEPPEADWWLASDGKWYPPDRKPGSRGPAGPPAPTWASASDAATWGPPDPNREPVKPVPAGNSRGSGSAGRPPVKPIPAPGRPPAPTREPAAKPPPPPGPNPGPGSGVTRPPATTPAAPSGPAAPPSQGPAREPAAARQAPSPPAAAPPAPPASRPPLGPITRPTRASDLEGPDEGDGSGRSPLEQMRARDEQSKKDAAVLVDARRIAAMRALGSLGVLKAEAEAEADASAEVATPPRAAKARPADAPASPPPASGDQKRPLLEIIPSQVLADDARTATRVTIHAEHVELRSRTSEVVRRIAIADITNVSVSKRFTGTSVTVESSSGAPVVVRGLRPDQADEVRSLLIDRKPSAGARGFMEAPAPPADPGPNAGETTPPEREPEPLAPDATETDVQLDESDLLAKLSALRDAGVLTEAEHDEKVELVKGLTRGETLAAAPGA